jgi:hypothetical protein
MPLPQATALVFGFEADAFIASAIYAKAGSSLLGDEIKLVIFDKVPIFPAALFFCFLFILSLFSFLCLLFSIGFLRPFCFPVV